MRDILDEPYFDEPYEVTLRYDNLSSRTEKGSSQSVSRQTIPKGAIRYSRRLNGASARARMVESLKDKSESCVVPYRCFGSSFSVSTDTVTPSDFEYMFRTGGKAVFWNGASSYLVVDVVSANGSTFDVGDGSALSGYSIVFPAFVGFMSDSPVEATGIDSSSESVHLVEY